MQSSRNVSLTDSPVELNICLFKLEKHQQVELIFYQHK